MANKENILDRIYAVRANSVTDKEYKEFWGEYPDKHVEILMDFARTFNMPMGKDSIEVDNKEPEREFRTEIFPATTSVHISASAELEKLKIVDKPNLVIRLVIAKNCTVRPKLDEVIEQIKEMVSEMAAVSETSYVLKRREKEKIGAKKKLDVKSAVIQQVVLNSVTGESLSAEGLEFLLSDHAELYTSKDIVAAVYGGQFEQSKMDELQRKLNLAAPEWARLEVLNVANQPVTEVRKETSGLRLKGTILKRMKDIKESKNP